MKIYINEDLKSAIERDDRSILFKCECGEMMILEKDEWKLESSNSFAIFDVCEKIKECKCGRKYSMRGNIDTEIMVIKQKEI